MLFRSKAQQRLAPTPAASDRTVASPTAQPVMASDPLDAQRADPWLKVSDLERAIGGRFDLPASLDMDADDARPVAGVAPAARPSKLSQPPDPASAPLAEPGATQRLAQSLEQAAACLRRNEIEQARSLLEDVLRSGDETQREFARMLLSRLG